MLRFYAFMRFSLSGKKSWRGVRARERLQKNKISDGKIFVVDLPRCVRIRTGTEGGEAI